MSRFKSKCDVAKLFRDLGPGTFSPLIRMAWWCRWSRLFALNALHSEHAFYSKTFPSNFWSCATPLANVWLIMLFHLFWTISLHIFGTTSHYVRCCKYYVEWLKADVLQASIALVWSGWKVSRWGEVNRLWARAHLLSQLEVWLILPHNLTVWGKNVVDCKVRRYSPNYHIP